MAAEPNRHQNVFAKFGKIAKSSALAALLIITLSSCVTALVAGAAIATIDIIHDRRSVGEYIDDGVIEHSAKNIFVNKDEYRGRIHVKPQSWNGILLLTGEISTPEIKQDLLSKFQNIHGVRQIVDETIISEQSSFSSRTNDTWISGKVKSKLILKTGLNANRVKIVTTRGNVYLMGIVTHEEANKATEHASTVRGVKRVIRVFEYKNKAAPKQKTELEQEPQFETGNDAESSI